MVTGIYWSGLSNFGETLLGYSLAQVNESIKQLFLQVTLYKLSYYCYNTIKLIPTVWLHLLMMIIIMKVIIKT